MPDHPAEPMEQTPGWRILSQEAFLPVSTQVPTKPDRKVQHPEVPAQGLLTI